MRSAWRAKRCAGRSCTAKISQASARWRLSGAKARREFGWRTYLIFNGVTASTLGGNFMQVVFELSPWLIVEGVALALIVGLIGGLFPALRAVRLPIVAGLYAS
jgi:hypothetical protein